MEIGIICLSVFVLAVLYTLFIYPPTKIHLKQIFYDRIEADYLFDNNFHFKSWTSKSWIDKSMSDDEAIEQEIDWLKTKNYTSCMRIRRNGKEIYN